jgi:hypothetical protein
MLGRRSSRDGRCAPLTALTEEERAVALERFQLLRRHLEDGVPLTMVAAAQAIPLRTARRWVQRLFSQIARVLEINRLRTITKEVVETARESLVIGPLG